MSSAALALHPAPLNGAYNGGPIAPGETQSPDHSFPFYPTISPFSPTSYPTDNVENYGFPPNVPTSIINHSQISLGSTSADTSLTSPNDLPWSFLPSAIERQIDSFVATIFEEDGSQY